MEINNSKIANLIDSIAEEKLFSTKTNEILSNSLKEQFNEKIKRDFYKIHILYMLMNMLFTIIFLVRIIPSEISQITLHTDKLQSNFILYIVLIYFAVSIFIFSMILFHNEKPYVAIVLKGTFLINLAFFISLMFYIISYQRSSFQSVVADNFYIQTGIICLSYLCSKFYDRRIKLLIILSYVSVLIYGAIYLKTFSLKKEYDLFNNQIDNNNETFGYLPKLNFELSITCNENVYYNNNITDYFNENDKFMFYDEKFMIDEGKKNLEFPRHDPKVAFVLHEYTKIIKSSNSLLNIISCLLKSNSIPMDTDSIQNFIVNKFILTSESEWFFLFEKIIYLIGVFIVLEIMDNIIYNRIAEFIKNEKERLMYKYYSDIIDNMQSTLITTSFTSKPELIYHSSSFNALFDLEGDDDYEIKDLMEKFKEYNYQNENSNEKSLIKFLEEIRQYCFSKKIVLLSDQLASNKMLVEELKLLKINSQYSTIFFNIGLFKLNEKFFNINLRVNKISINEDEIQIIYDFMLDNFTEVILSQKKMIETNLLEKLFSKVAHEFKTPILVIKSHTDQLKDAKIIKEDFKILINSILNLSDYTCFLVNDIITTFSHKNILIFKEFFDSKNLIKNCALVAKSLHKVLPGTKKTINVEYKIHEETNKYLLYSDENRLKQIIYNLLSNSIKFSQKGNVVISSEMIIDEILGEQMKISVEDQGIGMTTDQIFQFLNNKEIEVNTNLKYNKMGSGLGLFITKMLADKLGCKLEVKSEINKGTKISILFGKNFLIYKRLEDNDNISDNVHIKTFQHHLKTYSSINLGTKIELDTTTEIITNESLNIDYNYEKSLAIKKCNECYDKYNMIENCFNYSSCIDTDEEHDQYTESKEDEDIIDHFNNNKHKVNIQSKFRKIKENNILSNKEVLNTNNCKEKVFIPDKSKSNLELPKFCFQFEDFISYEKIEKSSNNNIILIIDDNYSIRKSISNLILGLTDKFIVIEGTDGIDTLKLIYDIYATTTKNIKLIISDESMEYINGSEAISIISELQKSKLPKFKKVCSTAFSDSFSHSRLIEKGFDNVYSKPMTKTLIKEILNDLC